MVRLQTASLQLPSLDLAGSLTVFSPEMVSEVAAGYWYDPLQATGSDSIAFASPEAGAKATHNLTTPSADAAPQITTVNGKPAIEYLSRTSPLIDELARTGNVQRGFTGSAMLWAWISCAAGPGVVLFHSRSPLQFALSLGSADVRGFVHDGTSQREQRFPLPPGGYAAPFFYCLKFVASEAVASNRIQLEIDRVAQAPTLTASPGTTMQDAAAVLGCCGSLSDGSGFNTSSSATIGCWGLTLGIPSDADLDRLFNHRRMK